MNVGKMLGELWRKHAEVFSKQTPATRPHCTPRRRANTMPHT